MASRFVQVMETDEVKEEDEGEDSMAVEVATDEDSDSSSEDDDDANFPPGVVVRRTEQDGVDEEGMLVDEEESEDDAKFIEAWEFLLEVVETELKNIRSNRGLKRKRKQDYDKIIQGLKMRTCGFSNKELEIIWKVVRHSACNLNCTQRRQLILMMVPQTKVSDQLIKSIVFWLTDAQRKGFKPTEVIGIYQLLNLYVEYNFVEHNGIMNEIVATRILSTHAESFVLPWKMRLFRNIITPDIITEQHIVALKKMLKVKDVKKAHVEDINAALGICHLMCPHLFSPDESFVWKIRTLNFPRDAVELFYQRKLSMNLNATKELHPMADKIFPEFLPDKQRKGRFVSKNILETMLEHLDSVRGTVRLAMTPALLDVFQQWLKPMLDYRFLSFSQCSKDDEVRYSFIFEKCKAITKVRAEGLPVLNEWLMMFIRKWDFSIFQGFIFNLIPFMEPSNVIPDKRSLSKIFLTQFANYRSSRCVIWEALQEMCSNWINKFEQCAVDDIIWLIDFLETLIRPLVFDDPETEEENGSTFLLYRMCEFYMKMQHLCTTIPSLPDNLKIKMKRIPTALFSAVFLSDSSDCVEGLTNLVMKTGPRPSASSRADKDVNSYWLAIDGLLAGNGTLISGIKSLVVLPELDNKVQDDLNAFSSSQRLQRIKSEWPQDTQSISRPSTVRLDQIETEEIIP